MLIISGRSRLAARIQQPLLNKKAATWSALAEKTWSDLADHLHPTQAFMQSDAFKCARCSSLREKPAAAKYKMSFNLPF